MRPSSLLLELQKIRSSYPDLDESQVLGITALRIGISQAKLASKLDGLIFTSKVESTWAKAMTFNGMKVLPKPTYRPEKAKVRFARKRYNNDCKIRKEKVNANY